MELHRLYPCLTDEESEMETLTRLVSYGDDNSPSTL